MTEIKADSITILDADGAKALMSIAESTRQIGGQTVLPFALFAYDASVSTCTKKVGIPITPELNGFNVKNVYLFCHTKGITGATEIQIVRRRAGADANVLSTTVSMGDEYYVADGTVNTSNDDLATGDILFVSVTAVHSGTAPLGGYGGIIVGPADP